MAGFTPKTLTAGATLEFGSSAIKNFIATASGTITIVAKQADGKPETTILNAFPVTAGNVYELDMFVGKNGGTVASAGGAAGVLCTT